MTHAVLAQPCARARFATAGLGVLIAGVLPVWHVASQSSPHTPDEVRLGMILDEVERVNPRLDAARSLARAARARVPSVTRPPDPQLQFGWMNYSLSPIWPMPPLGMSQLQLMQMIPVAGKLRLAGQVERIRASAAAARVGDASASLRAEASMAFFDWYAAATAVRVALDTRRLLEDLATIADRMYAVGEGRQADVLRARVAVARMQEDVVRMQAMQTMMATRLNALMVRDDSTRLGTPVLPVFPRVPDTPDSLTRLADRNRPALRAAELDVDAAAGFTQLARRDIWPDVLVGLQYGQQPGTDGPQRMGSLMFGATVPIFARSRQLQAREEANAMLGMAAAELASMRTETRGAVAESFANLSRARRLQDLYRGSILPMAEATVMSSRAAYRAGTVPFMTLLDAQMSLNAYRQEAIQLEAEEGKAWAELEMLTGHSLIDARSAQPVRPAGVPPT